MLKFEMEYETTIRVIDGYLNIQQGGGCDGEDVVVLSRDRARHLCQYLETILHDDEQWSR